MHSQAHRIVHATSLLYYHLFVAMSRSESSAGYMSVSSREADGGGHVGKASPPSSANSASLPQRGVMDVLVLIIMNVISSVAIVSVNKVLVVSYGFRFILLLSTTHFVSGWLFLHIASSPRFGLFERVSVPRPVVITIALAGTSRCPRSGRVRAAQPTFCIAFVARGAAWRLQAWPPSCS
ncbi:hypothetical protein EON67_04310 [archaeon]|nr:MAG: hypothetical protein EON67_04310 [archaeon]